MIHLPVGWALTTLGELTWPDRKRESPKPDDERLYLGMDAVEPHSGRVIEFARAGDYRSAAQVVKPGFTLYGRLRPYLNKVVEAAFEGLCSAEFIAFPPRDWLAPRFLMYRFMAPDFLQFTANLNQGDRPRVSAEQIAMFPLALPPLAEQQRIVATVEASLDRLVSGTVGLKQGESYSGDYRRIVEDRAVLGRLITTGANPPVSTEHDLAVISECRSSRASRRRIHPQPPSPFHYEIPSHWAVASMDELCWDIEYGTSVKTHDEGGLKSVPVLRMGNIQDSRIVMESLKFLPQETPSIESLMLQDGDLLFNRTNSAELVGKSAVYRETLGQATFASYLIRCRFAGPANPDWANLVINSSIGKSYLASVVSQQVGQANVNGTKLARMPIPFPPLSEQSDILTAVEEHGFLIDRLMESIKIGLDYAGSLRKSVLSAAFSGSLVPQDPRDESASVLLEQARTARPAATRRGRSPEVAVQEGMGR